MCLRILPLIAEARLINGCLRCTLLLLILMLLWDALGNPPRRGLHGRIIYQPVECGE